MTRVVRLVLFLGVVLVIGYSGYVGMVGSEALLRPDRAAGCATPATEHGWAYEAINYDQELDPSTADSSCDIGPTSSRDVAAADGVPITGWYIPAGLPTTESAAVLLIHGWNADPSLMLDAAALLHDEHDLVLVALRGGGRSGDADITFGVRERDDVVAVVDWLEATHPHSTIVLLGESMGGAVALATAALDERIDGVVVDSTHASFVTVLERRLAVEEGHPPQPGALAIALGAWVRSGHDLRSVDPAKTVSSLGQRPLLIVHGSDGVIDVPDQSAEVIAAAARDSGAWASGPKSSAWPAVDSPAYAPASRLRRQTNHAQHASCERLPVAATRLRHVDLVDRDDLNPHALGLGLADGDLGTGCGDHGGQDSLHAAEGGVDAHALGEVSGARGQGGVPAYPCDRATEGHERGVRAGLLGCIDEARESERAAITRPVDRDVGGVGCREEALRDRVRHTADAHPQVDVVRSVHPAVPPAIADREADHHECALVHFGRSSGVVRQERKPGDRIQLERTSAVVALARRARHGADRDRAIEGDLHPTQLGPQRRAVRSKVVARDDANAEDQQRHPGSSDDPSPDCDE